MRNLLFSTLSVLAGCAPILNHPPSLEMCKILVSRAIDEREKRNFEKSLSQFKEHRKCVERYTNVGMMHFYNLGWTYYEMGLYSDAVKAFDKGMIEQKDYPWAYWRRALAYEKIGNMELARRDFLLANKYFLRLGESEYKNILLKYPDVREKMLHWLST